MIFSPRFSAAAVAVAPRVVSAFLLGVSGVDLKDDSADASTPLQFIPLKPHC